MQYYVFFFLLFQFLPMIFPSILMWIWIAQCCRLCRTCFGLAMARAQLSFDHFPCSVWDLIRILFLQLNTFNVGKTIINHHEKYYLNII